MPTARELLEQADALMRRNRAAPAADVAQRQKPPDKKVSATAPAVAQDGSPASRPIQREPIPTAVARTSPPVDSSESPCAMPGEAASAPVPGPMTGNVPPPRESADAEIPLLTDAVPEATAGRLDAFALPASREGVDDVPLLTDAVEEIDVPIVDEAAHGEPSFWEMTARGETSVLGPAPDSVVVVPPPDLPPPGRDPLGLDQPPRGFVPSDAASAAAAGAARLASILPPLPQEAWADGEPAPDEAFEEGASAAKDEAMTRTGDEAASLAVPSIEPDAAVPAAASESMPLAAPLDDSDERERSKWAHDNDARIREVAEEISMQVLQRIDIFADTSLRSQLVERLKPAVDRASADLVAHINQHVGELLRAFVAEAIEREIENWRDREKGSEP